MPSRYSAAQLLPFPKRLVTPGLYWPLGMDALVAISALQGFGVDDPWESLGTLPTLQFYNRPPLSRISGKGTLPAVPGNARDCTQDLLHIMIMIPDPTLSDHWYKSCCTIIGIMVA